MGLGDSLRRIGTDADIGAQTFRKRSNLDSQLTKGREDAPGAKKEKPPTVARVTSRAPQQPLSERPLTQHPGVTKMVDLIGEAGPLGTQPAAAGGGGRRTGGGRKGRGRRGRGNRGTGNKGNLATISQSLVSKAIPSPTMGVGARTVTSVADLAGTGPQVPIGEAATVGGLMDADAQALFRKGKLNSGILPLSSVPKDFQQAARTAHGQRSVGWNLDTLTPAELNVLRTLSVNASRQQ